MGVEIERKFLVRSDAWQPAPRQIRVRQAYLAITETNNIRVRLSDAAAWLTVKGKAIAGARPEFEYDIPLPDAEELVGLSPFPVIEKTRHFVEHAGLMWEIDVFAGANQGLVLAEVELDDIQQPVEIPDWIGEEVTGDIRYHNAHLCREPYGTWSHT